MGLGSVRQQVMARSKWLLWLAAGIIALAFMASNARTAVKQVRDNLAWLHGDRFAGYALPWATYFRTIQQVTRDAKPDAVIATRKPQLAYLFGGRKAVLYAYSQNPDSVWRSIAPADYIIVCDFFPEDSTYLYPAVDKYRDSLYVVCRNTVPGRTQSVVAFGVR